MNKKSEAEALSEYVTYFDSYIKGDVKTIGSLLDEAYTQIGSAEKEVFFNKKDALQFINETIDQVAGKAEIRNRVLKTESIDSLVLVNDLFDMYVLIENEWTFYSKFRASTLMEKKAAGWKFIHQHSSMPDSRTQDGDNIAIEKISAENLHLREAVKRRTVELEQKNRELEIETALERVRAVAMSMNKPDDMLEVCRIIAEQLAFLNVKEIRNVQTAIIYESKGTYLNYEYYAKHHKLFVTEVDFKNHKIQASFANQMQKGAGELFSQSLVGKELNEWYNFQKTTNQFVDSFLEHAPSLNYYWYSLGPVALGISTYIPLSEDELNLFKRFRNVFELSYRRFIDIEIAITQATEAQLEASLERVRAQALSMRTPGDLAGICEVLYAELVTLGFGEIRNAMINIHDDEKSSFVNYDYSDEIGKSINHLVYNIHPVIEKQIKQIRSGGDAFSETSFTGRDLEDWKAFRKKIGEKDDPRIEKTDALFYYFYSIGTGAIGISTFSAITDEKKNVLKRFRNVFDFAYRRYMDVALAETQTREAQIELALERLRARTMAMQRSEELAKTVSVLFKQLLDLGVQSKELRTCGIVTFNPDEPIGEIWSTDPSGEIVADSFITRYDEAPAYKKIYAEWKNGEKFLVVSLFGDAFYEHVNYLLQRTKIPITDTAFIQKMEPEMHLHVLYFSQGYLFIITYKPLPEYHEIFKRFGAVFQQTYTRFLDFKKAEAQARESQIELGLERVRARAMAMQKSGELSELVDTVFKELTKLDFALTWCIINIIDESSMSNTVWAANPDINKEPESYHMLFEDYPFHHAMMKGWKERKTKCVYTLEGDEKKIYDEYLFNETAFKRTPEAAQAASRAMEKYVVSFSFSNFGGLQTVGDVPLTDANLDILSRFGKVFDLTYTRFNDLKQAEAQTRESQIQLALERVRARTMAMQKSDELKNAATLLFQQVKSLGVPAYSCGYNIWEKDDKEFTSWMSTQDGTDINGVPNISLTEDANFIRFADSRQKGEQFFVLELRGERMQEHYQYLKTIPAFKANFDYAISVGFDLPETQIHHLANFSQGNLLFITLEPCPEFHDVFKRFAAVFEQTYTRFLDLQNAEAQARESQIQLALERVRARTMAMQKSDELPETSFLLFQQVKELGETTVQNSIGIVNEEAGFVELSTTVRGHNLPRRLNVPIDDPYVMAKAVAAWKANRKSLKLEFVGQELKTYNEYRNSFFETKVNFPEDQWIVNIIFFSKGWLSFSCDKNISDETFELVTRFAAVFEQTYTRFNDLKQAEEQARESQIQLALERVRARTMAMQKSDELMETAVVLFDHLKQLGENIERTMIGVVNEEEHVVDVWATRQDGSQMDKMQKFPIDEPILLQKVYSAWQQQKKSIVIDLQGEELESYFHFLKSRASRIKSENFGKRRVENFAFFSKGFLGVISSDPNTAANVELYERFAAVFDQTYTRFLDLQKAEAQVREAQIEAALERVRSRSMGMQKSEELGEVSHVINSQLQQLNFKNYNAGFLIDYSQSDDFNICRSDSTGSLLEKTVIPYFDHPIFNHFIHAKETGLDFYTVCLTFEEKNKWVAHALPHLQETPQEVLQFLYGSAGYATSCALLKHVGLFIENFDGIPFSQEENTVLMRFGKVFEQTYTRFLDLKKAEAQAREAQIEAVLERVRSRTMAMQKSDELTDVAGLLFEQVSALGVKTWTAGFNVWSEDNNSYVDYITSPQGGFIEPYTVYTETAEALTDISNARKSGVEFDVQYVEGEKIKQLYLALTKLDEKQYEIMLQDGVRFPSHQYEHFVFGSKVSLMFITYEPVPKAHDIFKRLGKVFEQTYTRFLDLQKAEAQSREAQIEAALERVRSRSIGMQKSEDLKEVIKIIYQQLTHLKINLNHAGFVVDYSPGGDWHFWIADEQDIPAKITHPYFESVWASQFNEAKEKGADFFATNLNFEEKNKFYVELLSYVPGLPEASKDFYLSCPGLAASTVLLDNVGLYIENFSGLPYSDEENATLMRFGKVFQQTYTRFLDLQKAEAQAREAQIEAALERVRSRTMAMQRSDELQGAASLLFQQVQVLGARYFSCGFNIWDDDKKEATAWMAREQGFQPPFKTSSSEDVFLQIHEASQTGESLFVAEQGGEVLEMHYKYMASIPVFKCIMDKMAEVGLSVPSSQIIHCAFFSQGYLMFISFEPVPGAHDIFKRFAKVFEQTYTRFLDLQKAEAQARVAQIELGLERVRARSMAMHKSDELAELVQLLFKQLEELDFGIYQILISIYDTKKNQIEWWSRSFKAIDLPQRSTIPIIDHPFPNQLLAEWKSGTEYLAIHLEGETKKNWDEYLFTKTDLRFFPAELIEMMRDVEEVYLSTAFMKHGGLEAAGPAPLPDDKAYILKRFAKVLDMAYTRMTDLQNAEAQTREAQIELGLERVRARAMAMQKSHELKELIGTVFIELTKLDLVLTRCVIIIYDPTTKDATWWMANSEAPSDPIGLIVQYHENAPNLAYIKAWQERKLTWQYILEGKDKKDWDDFLFVKTELSHLPDFVIEGMKAPDKVYLSASFNNFGNLTLATLESLSEEHANLLLRFGKVFDLTYTRFNDLLKAEAQAKEAIKASSLDRVRAEIASMRTIDDLQRITPLIWHELTALGVPFIRCGVFIIDEAHGHAQVYLSAPDGHSLAVLDLPYTSNILTANAVDHWRRGIVYAEHWNKEDFINWTQSMMKEGQVQNPETYQGASTPPESLHLHFVPFSQGMLYAGNILPLTRDEIGLVKSLAESFSIAYARYEDFKQLEKAKQSIESTLTELKATQTQLIQSEKMASLGELTAGIAHEIQNPLNFVNNFSEVNAELIEELKSEWQKAEGERNLQLTEDILNDIAKNEEKIIHHGKRADAIVKGMLQHSRSSNAVKEPTDINKLADEYFRLAYHGLRAKDKSFNATLKTNFDEGIGNIQIIPQDIGRVMLNLITNAFYAVAEKKKSRGENYEPIVTVSTALIPPSGGGGAVISVKDNGNGIPKKILDKIFQPFFTTKPTGQGTGLGLSLAYDIVKAQGGELRVETKEGEGSEFIIQLPVV